MPATNVPAMPHTTVWATADLGDDARITIVADDLRPGMVTGRLGSTDHLVRILTTPATLRRLLTDALAQLSAIEAGQ